MKLLLIAIISLTTIVGFSQVKSCEDIIFPTLNSSLYQGVYYNDYKWDANQEITVTFLNGSQYVKDQVKKHALKWCDVANVTFRFTTDPASDIRISFREGMGSWSLIGKQSLQFSVDPSTGNAISGKSGPSMNFGWFNESTEDIEFQRTTLHEFGHALSLLHEHLNPNSGIQWNKPKVYAYYMQTQHWSKEMVDKNVLDKYSVTQTNNQYDPHSIMHYPVNKELTLDHYEVGWNNDLSEDDKLLIRDLYPFDDTELPTDPDDPITTPDESGVSYRITDLVYGDDIWSLVMSKSAYDFSQEWTTDEVFPKAEIQENYNAGHLITNLAYGDGVWAVVMSNGTAYTAQKWRTRTVFPEADLEELYDEEYLITQLTYGNGVWALVMSKGTGYYEQQWRTSEEFPLDEINELYDEGYMITNLTYGDGIWALVMSKGTEFTGQEMRKRDYYPKDEIAELWKKGYSITNLTFGDGSWTLVMSKNAGFSTQSWRTRTAFPEAEIDELWNK